MIRIRIEDPDRRPLFSIAVVLSAAGLTWLAAWLWGSAKSPPPVYRDPAQVQVLYECDHGHRFTAPLAMHSRECAEPQCDERSWPLWSYQCSRDGAFLLQVRYAAEGGRLRMKAARPLNGAWQTVDREVLCPGCGRALIPDHTLSPWASRGPR